ncbi:MAG: blue-light-activated histidine kinase [Hyphomicrobiales bacterium]|nr:blue-light-activated histidine kinase [Hyphomicrobiales bacterium]
MSAVSMGAEIEPSTLAAKPHLREQERLAALHRYDILDTPREQDFDDIAALASEICDTPIAAVNLIAEGRQWFKAEVGLGVRETPLETSFCGHALLEADFMIVPDATKDVRFNCNPLVTGPPGLRFYAGALLKSEENLPIGTLCVLDRRARTLNERQIRSLTRLARQVMTQMELRRSARLHSLLAHELQHRVKNTLAVVQAIAYQTFRDVAHADANAAFMARLVALGQAHDRLTETSWTAAPLSAVIEGALQAHQTGAARQQISGPELQIGASPALSLSLALHELATNAVKYGALSNDSGRVDVTWSVNQGMFRLLWSESGGPVVAPPTRRGFGSRLVERSLTSEFGAEVVLSFGSEGLRCEVTAPLEALRGRSVVTLSV